MENKGKTWMENYCDKCVLCWGGGKFYKKIPHDAKTNTPVFHSAPTSLVYRAFVTTFDACEAPFFSREHVLQFSGGLREHTDPAEFITEKDIHLRNYLDAAKVREGDDTIKTSNLTYSPSLNDSIEPSEQATHQGALTFDPSPPATADKDIQSPPPTIKLNSCNGTTASATFPSCPLSKWLQMARSPRSWARSSPQSALAASLAQ